VKQSPSIPPAKNNKKQQKAKEERKNWPIGFKDTVTCVPMVQIWAPHVHKT